MKKFEYREEWVSATESVMGALAELGDDGWELCAISRYDDRQEKLYLKREIPQPDYPLRMKNHQRPVLSSFVPGSGGETVVH